MVGEIVLVEIAMLKIKMKLGPMFIRNIILLSNHAVMSKYLFLIIVAIFDSVLLL